MYCKYKKVNYEKNNLNSNLDICGFYIRLSDVEKYKNGKMLLKGEY